MILGLAVSLVVAHAAGATTSATRFSIVTSSISRSAVPGSLSTWDGQGNPGEGYPYIWCRWSPSRTSITVAQAATYSCNASLVDAPLLVLPAPGSFEILATPISGEMPQVENGGLTDELRFVTRDDGVVHVGPPLMEFADVSGGARPSFDEADGSLWIFDDRTERGSEVIRISTATGALLQRTAMPAISRPIIGVNALGFWLAQDADSLGAAPEPQLGVWLAAIGASHGELVKANAGDFWAMQSDGDAMDIFVSPGTPPAKLTYEMWRLTPIH
jgi:hypothetical protein